MIEEHRGFKAENVRRGTVKSEALGGGYEPRPPLPGRYEAMDVTCNDCGHAWTARRYGDGKFDVHIGVVEFSCPACGQNGTVESADLPT
jgi:ribosomal protein S27E